MRAAVIAACAVIAGTAAPTRADPEPSPTTTPSLELDRGRDSFRRGDWQSTIQMINPLLYPELQLARKEQVVEAHIMLGAAHYQAGNRQRAREEFDRALRIEPDQSLTTRMYSEGAIRLFDETKTDLKIRMEREQEKRRLAQRLKEIEDYRKSLIVYETHPYYVNFIPFGAGQFQNRQRNKGILFATTQSITAGVSLSIFLYLATKYGLEGSVPVTEARTVRSLQQIEIATGAAFFGFYAWGLVDALLHYKPRQRVEGDDTLLPPELRDPATKRRPPPPKKTSLRFHPLLVPDGAGVGLSLELF